MEHDEQNKQLLDLYQDIILDHSSAPRHFGVIQNADAHSEGYNPLCGDRIQITLKYNQSGNQIEKTQFSGSFCSICMASASIMTEEVENISKKDALDKINNIRSVMQSKSEDLHALTGVRNHPSRIKCVLLPWTTLQDALKINKGATNDRT